MPNKPLKRAELIDIAVALAEDIAALIRKRTASLDGQQLEGVAAGALVSAAQLLDGSEFIRPGVTGSLADVMANRDASFRAQMAAGGVPVPRWDPPPLNQRGDR